MLRAVNAAARRAHTTAAPPPRRLLPGRAPAAAATRCAPLFFSSSPSFSSSSADGGQTPATTRTGLLALLESVADGRTSAAAALDRIRALDTERIGGGYALVDHHRTLRTGFPEVVFGSHKTPEQIAAREEEERHTWMSQNVIQLMQG